MTRNNSGNSDNVVFFGNDKEYTGENNYIAFTYALHVLNRNVGI